MNRTVRTLAMVASISMMATLAAAQATPDGEGWRTIIYPINGWLPVFGADVRLPEPPGGGGGGTIPSATTSGNFDGAAAAGFRIERSRLSIEGSALWAGMSGEVEAPFFLLSVDTVSAKLVGGFRLAPALYADGGVRHLALKMNARILDFPNVEWKPGIWEAVVGLTFRPQFGKKLRLFTQADLGGIGDDQHRSVAATGILEWKPVAHFAIGGGYGVLYLRADGTILTKPVHLEQTLHGPKVTIGIPF